MWDYRDPIYGFIRVNENEQAIIDTDVFQRLRAIKQLGTTFLIYPTANHTRFEHSLGTLEVSTRLFDSLLSDERSASCLEWGKDDIEFYRKMLRYAALLHDVGHGPFSHTMESLLKEGSDHESLTYGIITETDVIRDVINSDLGKDGHVAVADVATGAPKSLNNAFISELLTGDFGSDRLDYLLRDSYHLGVSYGRYDLQRLLNTLMIRINDETNGPELTVEDGGVHSVEGVLLARYFMFLEVYYHKTRRILDRHLAEFIEMMFPEGYPSSLSDYLELNDSIIMSELMRRKGEEVAQRVLGRKHFRLAFETTEHPSREEIVVFDWLKEKIADNFQPDQVRFDTADKAPYNFEQPPIMVFWQDRYCSLKERSPLTANLKRLQKLRIYCHQDIRQYVRHFCEDFWRNKCGGGRM